MTLDKFLSSIAKQPDKEGVLTTPVNLIIACWYGAVNTRLAGTLFTQIRVTDLDGNIRSFDWQEDVGQFVER